MPGWPDEWDNRPCQCPECVEGPGINFQEKERLRQIRYMDERIKWFLEDGWKVESEIFESGTGDTEF